MCKKDFDSGTAVGVSVALKICLSGSTDWGKHMVEIVTEMTKEVRKGRWWRSGQVCVAV